MEDIIRRIRLNKELTAIFDDYEKDVENDEDNIIMAICPKCGDKYEIDYIDVHKLGCGTIF